MIEEEHFAFAEKDKNGNIQYFHGLKNFLKFSPPCHYNPVYIFDNHHHALSFRYLEYLRSKKVCTLLHIDQHSDMQDNQFSLPDDLLETDRSHEIFQFVLECCTVGNFIQPALKS
ncbi:MAG: UPF0489 family protein [Candidatus Peribacteria bacterium]|jgi:hypothetical protein|nr:UPF0489 family protein [Candidatus Peribacteria bacterium]